MKLPAANPTDAGRGQNLLRKNNTEQTIPVANPIPELTKSLAVHLSHFSDMIFSEEGFVVSELFIESKICKKLLLRSITFQSRHVIPNYRRICGWETRAVEKKGKLITDPQLATFFKGMQKVSDEKLYSSIKITTAQEAPVTSYASPNKYNVDYFSHNWDELDLKTSWSFMTKKKKTLIDGIRLENASWRKWMQKRLNLPRIPPESLRWKKDEDITWLYGPFYRTNFKSTASQSKQSTSTMEDDRSKNDNVKFKSSLKKGSLNREFVKFSLEVDRRIRKKFQGSPPSLKNQPPFVLKETFSDSNLWNLEFDPYLDRNELKLLQFMQEGPNDAFEVSFPTCSPKGQIYFPGDEGITSQGALVTSSGDDITNSNRKGKLRFNTEIQVVEYDKTVSRRSEPTAQVRKAVAEVDLDLLSAELDSFSLLPSDPSNHVIPLSLDAVHEMKTIHPDSPDKATEDNPSWIKSIIDAATWLIPPMTSRTSSKSEEGS